MQLFRFLLGRAGLPRRSAPGTGTGRRLLFLHIPKTAGISVTEFLVQRFQAGQLCRLDHWKLDESGNFKIPEGPVCCYSGHVGYGFTRRLPSDTVVFTILRDPIERAISSYSYWRSLSLDVLSRHAPYLVQTHDLTLPEFIRACPDVAEAGLGNLQTGFLSSSESQKPPGLDYKADLARARDNLSRCLVGLTEHLEDSLANLCHEFDWPHPERIPRQNTTPHRAKVSDLDAQTRAWLEEHTALDAELYRFGKQLFLEWSDRVAKKRSERPPAVPPVGRHYCLTFDQPIPGYGWCPREVFQGTHFCWCPEEAWLECPALEANKVRVEINTLSLLPPQHEGPLTLYLNGQPVPLSRRRTRDGNCHVGTARGQAQAQVYRLDFRAERPVRPCDVCPGSTDDRLLGFAIRQLSLRAG